MVMWLALDTKLEVVDRLSLSQIIDYYKYVQGKEKNWVINNIYKNRTMIYKGKECIFVEDDVEKETERKSDGVNFYIDAKGSEYYCDKKGKFWKIDKYGRKYNVLKHILKERNSINAVIYAGGKKFLCKNVIAEAFVDGYKSKKTWVYLKDKSDLLNVSVENILVIDKGYVERNTLNKMKNNKKIRRVALFDGEEKVKVYNGISECSKKLFLSTKSVTRICNGEAKRPQYDLRWEI